MTNLTDISQIINTDVEYFGVADLSNIEMRHTKKSRSINFIPKFAIVTLFSYFAGISDGNISLYARGHDYHLVIEEILDRLCIALRKKFDKNFEWFVDSSPYDEVELGVRAGLGVRGKNNLLLSPQYGSFCFIAEILTDMDIETDKREKSEPPVCIGCNKCIDSCPTGALGIMRSGKNLFNKDICLSHLTQKKGELSKEEMQLVGTAKMVWGCDACQIACPGNAGLKMTNIINFNNDLVLSINASDVIDNQFEEKYSKYAFLWRGKDVLMRNIKLTCKE